MYRELYEKAKAAYVNAYAPYSKLHVGAAILCGDGTVFTGVNVENASYGAGICAERSAAVTAVTQGHRDFRVIAICSDTGEAWPCGICRQFLYEFAPDMILKNCHITAQQRQISNTSIRSDGANCGALRTGRISTSHSI